mmetsp:Transcript_22789/g.53815  ORF Transcript_22789/g.53815 Transcript_22789/m.53815 type:complete len:205 (-) Transcript_22789:1016-1630(-)
MSSARSSTTISSFQTIFSLNRPCEALLSSPQPRTSLGGITSSRCVEKKLRLLAMPSDCFSSEANVGSGVSSHLMSKWRLGTEGISFRLSGFSSRCGSALETRSCFVEGPSPCVSILNESLVVLVSSIIFPLLRVAPSSKDMRWSRPEGNLSTLQPSRLSGFSAAISLATRFLCFFEIRSGLKSQPCILSADCVVLSSTLFFFAI